MSKEMSLLTHTFILSLLFSQISEADIIPPNPPEDPRGWKNKDAYRPNPVLFIHGFGAGSNYDWNPNPNAENQTEEEKKATKVLSEWFSDDNKYYSEMGKALHTTQVPYLETIDFFDRNGPEYEQVMDKNSSIDTYWYGDRYVEIGFEPNIPQARRWPGDPGWADKLFYAITNISTTQTLPYLLYIFDRNINEAPLIEKYQTKIKLAAHSMGGLASREYLTNPRYRDVVNQRDAKDKIDSLITAGTPHLGSHWASVANGITTLQDIAGETVLDSPNLAWLFTYSGIEALDMYLENFNWVDIDGDAENDMDPSPLGSGFLKELNDPEIRPHPQGVRYYVIYGTLPASVAIEAFSTQYMIYWLISHGVSLEEIEELLEDHYDMEIGILEIVNNGVGDLVVARNSQQGKRGDERIFEIAKEDEIIVWHGKEPVVAADGGNASPLFKMLDDTKPVIEITEIRDWKDSIIWRSGQAYFELPENGILKVHGLCSKEYLPADTYVNVGFRKPGEREVNWIIDEYGYEVTTDQSEAKQWLLQPSDQWRANDPDSTVAEFEIWLWFPKTEAYLVVEATNPAGVKSDKVEVRKKSWYFVLADNNEHRIYFIDAEIALETGAIEGTKEFAFNPVDENYNQIREDINGLGELSSTISFCHGSNIREFDINGFLSGSKLSTQDKIPQSLWGQNIFLENNKLWYIDNNGNITLGSTMQRFNPPATWEEDTEFIGTGLKDITFVCSKNKLKKLGQIDYGIWDFDLPWTGTGLSYKGRTKTGYTGLFYGTGNNRIYEFEIKNPTWGLNDSKQFHGITDYKVIRHNHNDSIAIEYSPSFVEYISSWDFYEDEQPPFIVEGSLIFEGEEVYEYIAYLAENFGQLPGLTYSNSIDSHYNGFGESRGYERSRFVAEIDLTNVENVSDIKWAYAKDSIFSMAKVAGYYQENVSPFFHNGLDFRKTTSNINLSNLSYRTLFEMSGDLILHIGYPDQTKGSAQATFPEMDLLSYLTSNTKNLFIFLYPGDNNPPYKKEYPIRHANILWDISLETVKIFIQTPEQEGKLDVLRTVSADGLNLEAIAIVEPGQIPSMQIRGDSSVNIGGAIQLRTVGVAPISWSVSDNTKATIDDSGLLTGLDAGTITITATDAIGQRETKEITIN